VTARERLDMSALGRDITALFAVIIDFPGAVFGSYVRHAARESSDIDLLVSFSDPPGLLRFVELENFLSARLGVKVDLVMRDALKPRIGRRVLAEAVPV
jgi:uncharacterized protein